MVRPTKDTAERRTETLAFRLTPAERLQIEETAHTAGMSASAYARIQSLSGKVVVQQSRTLDPEAFDQLRRIGVNLNQLTRLAHGKQEIPPGLSRLCEQIEQLLARELSGGP